MPPRAEREALRSFLAAFLPFGLGLVLLAVFALRAEAHREFWPQEQILAAIRAVESGGRSRPPDGDNGAAIGPYQIHFGYWLDAVAGDPAIRGNYQDCRDRVYAERIITAYMRRYAPEAWRRGRAETIARIHNGGPQGARRAATLPYWQRVRDRLPQ